MIDLISRQAAIDYLMVNMNWYEEDGYESDEDYKRGCITDLINGVPSAQPEIVRCKDCKHKIQALSTEQGATSCELIRGTFYEDFFCKCGERRADERTME